MTVSQIGLWSLSKVHLLNMESSHTCIPTPDSLTRAPVVKACVGSRPNEVCKKLQASSNQVPEANEEVEVQNRLLLRCIGILTEVRSRAKIGVPCGKSPPAPFVAPHLRVLEQGQSGQHMAIIAL